MEEELVSIGVGVASSAATAVAYEAWRRSTEREIIMGRPARLQKVDPGSVAFDADTFQFKSGGDQHGVTDRLRGVKSWDPVAAGKAVVFERANGELVVADGHQRTGLAKRLTSEGQTGIRLDAYVLRERDGWSARDVRVYAAIKNMKELSGQSLDMAKVMRERPDLVNDSLPMSDGKLREARALAHLSEPAFRKVASGEVKPEVAAAVGESVKDSSRHAAVLDEMTKAKVASGQHARLYVGQAMAAPTITETTSSLFGDETQVRSLVSERAQVLDKAITSLRQDKRLFSLLEREANTIEGAGNKLAHDVNITRAAESGQTAALVERLATSRGPVSAMLDRAAEAVARGEKPAKAARAFSSEVAKTLKSGGINALLGTATPQTAGRLQEMVDRGPVKLGAGDIVSSATGRDLSPFPKVDTSTNGKTGNTLKRVDAWLHTEALAEARATRNNFVETLLRGMDPKRLTTSDRDSLNQILFGDPDGPTPSMVRNSPRNADSSPRTTQNSPRTGAAQTSFLPEATTQEKITAEMQKTGKARVAQQDVGGLFGDGMKQIDLVDEAKRPNPILDDWKAGKLSDVDAIAESMKADRLAREAHGSSSRQATQALANMDEIDRAIRQKHGMDPHWSQKPSQPVSPYSVRINGKMFPAESLEQASKAYRASIDAMGIGASQTPRAEVFDSSGKLVGNIAYNGRVFPGTPEAWKSTDAPLYDPYNRTNLLASPQQDAKVLADLAARIRTQSKDGAVLSADDVAKIRPILGRITDGLASSGAGRADPSLAALDDAAMALNRMVKGFEMHGPTWQSNLDASWLEAASERVGGGKALGWTDAARVASAEARAADVKPARTPALPSAVKLTEMLRDNKMGDYMKSLAGKTPEQLRAMAAKAEAQVERGRKMQESGERGMGSKRGDYFAHSNRQKDGVWLEHTYKETAAHLRSLAGQKEAEAKLKAGSGLRGTQNAANLEAIVENRKANAKPRSARSNPELVKALADKFNSVVGVGIKELPSYGKPETFKPAQDRQEALVKLKAEIEAAKLSKADAQALAKAVGNTWIPPSASGKKALQSVMGRVQNGIEHVSKTLATGGRTAASILGPVAIVGGAAIAFDATRNSAKAAGGTDLEANMKAVGAGLVAGGTIAGIGVGMAYGIKAAAKLAPVAGKVLARAVPLAAVAVAAYEVGKGAYEGGKKDGFKGAVKGAGVGALHFASAGAYSHFAAKGQTPTLTADQAAQFKQADSTFRAMQTAKADAAGPATFERTRTDWRTGETIHEVVKNTRRAS